MASGQLIQFRNCRILRNHQIIKDDIWVRDGKIINPEKVFYDEQRLANIQIDCKNAILSPGFIDIQINGGYGVDFSYDVDTVEKGVQLVAKKMLEHGVTSFCPTIVTSPPETYKKVLPKIPKRSGSKDGATILGVHVEGPFINVEKKGAHPPKCIKELTNGFKTLQEMYGSLDNIKIISLAPEKENAISTISELHNRGIAISLGHSMANLCDGELAVQHGATLITHLFNAMLPFHHRDPGLVGLLTSTKIPEGRKVFYGIIADGVHTHPAALRIAYRTNQEGLILVTDAISALGLEEGMHHIGQMDVEVRGRHAYVAGTKTLCGSIAPMDECIRIFQKATKCSAVHALESASLHPAQSIHMETVKGSLDFGADADFVLLTDDLQVMSTWIAGECVFQKS